MEVRNGCEVRKGAKCGGVHSQYSPLCPGVRAASLEEYLFTCFSNTIPPKYTSKMAFLSGSVGRLTVICRSNLPGRNRAWSNTLSRLVEAKMTTPSEGVMPVMKSGEMRWLRGRLLWGVSPSPSISTSSWFRVLSCSS